MASSDIGEDDSFPAPNGDGGNFGNRPSKADLYSDEELESLLNIHQSLSETTFSSDSTASSSATAKEGEDEGDSFMSLHEFVVQQTSAGDLAGTKNGALPAQPLVQQQPEGLSGSGSRNKYRQLLDDDPTLRSKLESVRMVASDVDGTLLTSDHKLHPTTLSAIKRAVRSAREERKQQDGNSYSGLQHFVLATGKSRAGALGSLGEEVTELLSRVPGVFIQGLYCVDANGDVVYEQKLENSDAVVELERLANQYNMSLVAYDGDAMYATASSKPHHILEIHDKYGEPRPTILKSLSDHFPKQFHKVLVVEDDLDFLQNEFRPKMEELASRYGCEMTRSVENMLELLPPKCSKAVGVEKLCEKLGVDPRRELLAIGDGENDVEMLQMASVGVAVGNAVPAAAEAADIELEETNNEGGAGIAIELFGMGDIIHQIEGEGYYQ